MTVVLTSFDGAVLPQPLQRLAAARTALRATAAADDRRQLVGEGRLQVRPGEYAVEVFDPSRQGWRRVGACRIVADADVVRVAVPDPGRAVRLSLDGLRDAAYVLQFVHESGYSERASGRVDHEHLLLLPRGPVVATVECDLGGGRRATHEHVFTVGEELEQEVRWRIPQQR